MSRRAPVMPRKRPEVLVADFDTELVVLVPDDRRAHHLDEGLSLVLDSCDGETLTADLVGEVVEATGRTTDEVVVWLEHAIESLRTLNMIQQ